MLKKSALVVSTALALALPAGAALAATDDVDDSRPAVTCDQSQQRLHAANGSGTADGTQAMTATRQRLRLQLDAECTGDGPIGGAGYGAGALDGTGPSDEGPMDGTGNQFGRAGR